MPPEQWIAVRRYCVVESLIGVELQIPGLHIEDWSLDGDVVDWSFPDDHREELADGLIEVVHDLELHLVSANGILVRALNIDRAQVVPDEFLNVVGGVQTNESDRKVFEGELAPS